MVSQPLERDQMITVRLSIAEKRRLAQVALAQDLRLSQLARRCINAHLATLDAEDAHDEPSDAA